MFSTVKNVFGATGIHPHLCRPGLPAINPTEESIEAPLTRCDRDTKKSPISPPIQVIDLNSEEI